MLGEIVVLVVALGVGCVGAAVHEATHYVACRAFGAPASPSFVRNGIIPDPCIVTDPFDHTPTTFRITTLAPLVVFVPSVIAALLTIEQAAAAHGPHAAVVYVAWLVATMPSGSDWRMAYRAGELPTLQAVREGDHTTHTAAEGIRA